MNLFKKRPAPDARDPIAQKAAEVRRQASDARAALKAFHKRMRAAQLPGGTWVRVDVETINSESLCVGQSGLWLASYGERRRPWRFWVSDVDALTAAAALPELERKLLDNIEA